jgi:hypothetical protein
MRAPSVARTKTLVLNITPVGKLEVAPGVSEKRKWVGSWQAPRGRALTPTYFWNLAERVG